MNEVRVFCPATVANVNCGFDALGFALEGIGDEMIVRKTKELGVTITNITGAQLPLDPVQNVAGVAALAMLEGIKANFGIAIEIQKNIRPGSGIGSSAASAAGIVYAINQFLQLPVNNLELTKYAMKGEALASGSEHADNVAPCIYGGITLITGYDPFKIITLPPLDTIYVAIWHPHIIIKTKEAREILPKEVLLKDAITQSGKLAGFVASLYERDKELFANSLTDVLIEPHRKNLIPFFDDLKDIALTHGAITFGISGSGPSMFAFSYSEIALETMLQEGKQLYHKKALEVDTYKSKISNTGCFIIN